MILTQDEYTLFTGEAISYSNADWTTLVNIASGRLASFLCLNELPGTSGDYADLGELLANFICQVFKFRGDHDAVDSKSVRNFTIKFKTSSAANAFAQIAGQYGDVIDKYSACDLGFTVERSKRYCCGRI